MATSTSSSASTTLPLFVESPGVYPAIPFAALSQVVSEWPVAVAGTDNGTTTFTYNPYSNTGGCYVRTNINGVGATASSSFTTGCKPAQAQPGYNTLTYKIASGTYMRQASGVEPLLGTDAAVTTGSFSLSDECKTIGTTLASCVETYTAVNQPSTSTYVYSSLTSLTPRSTTDLSARGWKYVTLYVTSGAEMLASSDRAKVATLGDAKATGAASSTLSPSSTSSSASQSSNVAGSPYRFEAPEAGMWALGLAAVILLVPAVIL